MIKSILFSLLVTFCALLGPSRFNYFAAGVCLLLVLVDASFSFVWCWMYDLSLEQFISMDNNFISLKLSMVALTFLSIAGALNLLMGVIRDMFALGDRR